MVNPRAVSYLVTAPGSLGMARAYLQGDLDIDGVHPGDPYELLQAIEELTMRRPSPAVVLQWLRALGLGTLSRRRCRTWSRRRPAGSASACGTAAARRRARSATTTTSPTTSTSWSSARR